ncbi:MAG: hypothetical protein QMD92_08340 [bacterium]|nr:hypothetical protein [bacterium]
MKTNLKDIKINKINIEDDSFSISYGRSREKLKNSILEIGLISLPILKKGKEYTVICGRQRLLVLKDLGYVNIKAMICSPINDLQAFLLNIHDNIYHRDLNEIEKSIILYKLCHNFNIEKNQLINQYLPLLNFSKNKKILEDYLNIFNLDDKIKFMIIAKKISLKNSLKLLFLSKIDQEKVLNLITALSLNSNKQREIISLLEEISKRNKKSISSIILDFNLQKILNNPLLNLEKKFEELRHLLTTLRYPRWSKDERLFKTLRKKLKLNPAIRLDCEPFFEKNEIKVEFKFKNPKELKDLAENLLDISSKKELQEIFYHLNK